MTDLARQKWAQAYSVLTAERPGLFGAVTARAEAQVIRLALIYALLDRSNQIDICHLEAALAVWAYCEASVQHIFGDALGDDIADTILRALRGAGSNGMSRSAIYDLLGRHQSRNRVGAALGLLQEKERARMEICPTGGRPTEMWFAC